MLNPLKHEDNSTFDFSQVIETAIPIQHTYKYPSSASESLVEVLLDGFHLDRDNVLSLPVDGTLEWDPIHLLESYQVRKHCEVLGVQ